VKGIVSIVNGFSRLVTEPSSLVNALAPSANEFPAFVNEFSSLEEAFALNGG
jgi:hypothetical protein